MNYIKRTLTSIQRLSSFKHPMKVTHLPSTLYHRSMKSTSSSTSASSPLAVVRSVKDFEVVPQSLLFTKRVIMFTDNIVAWESLPMLAAQLQVLKEQNALAPIYMLLNTYGGEVQLMLALHDVIGSSPCKVITVNIGRVCKSALLLLAAGEQRLSFPHAEIAFQQDHGHGNIKARSKNQQENYAKLSAKDSMDAEKIVKDRCTNAKGAQYIGDVYNYDGLNIINSKEALERGIIDEIVDSLPNFMATDY